jgi:hypothetical protein
LRSGHQHPGNGAGLVLIPVGNAWNWTRVLGDIRVDVDRPTDLAAVLARLTVELDEWLAALPYAKAGTAPMSVAAARKIPRWWDMTSSLG